MNSPPNDFLIRLTKDEKGESQYEILLMLNDETLLPEMQQTSDFLRRCLDIYKQSDAAIEYADAIKYAEGLVAPKPRIVLPH